MKIGIQLFLLILSTFLAGNFSTAQNPTVINDSLIVNQRLYAKEKLVVEQEAKFKQDLKVLGTARLQGDLIVDGTAKLNGNVKMENIEQLTTYDFNTTQVLIKLPNGQVKSSTLKDLIIATSALPVTIDYCQQIFTDNPQWYAGVKKLFTVCPEIKVGISTADPLHSLDVRGTAHSNTLLVGNALAPTTAIINGYSINFTNDLLKLGVKVGALGEEVRFSITNKGEMDLKNTGTGASFTIHNGHSHAVVVYSNSGAKIFQLEDDGLMRTREIRIDAASWADYVFDENYELPKLSEVAQFIDKNHHLPGIPSSAELKENGINVADMQAMQMQKIEELTLYMIEMDRKMDILQDEIEALKKENESLKK